MKTETQTALKKFNIGVFLESLTFGFFLLLLLQLFFIMVEPIFALFLK